MIHKVKPEQFKSKFDVVSCFVEHDKHILLLHRQDYKPQGNTRCLPAGKTDVWENLVEAVLREVFEETGIGVSPDLLTYHTTVYVQYADFDFVYHMFWIQLNDRPDVVLSQDEHKAFRRVSPEEALLMPLIEDEDACIKLIYEL